MKTTLHRIKEYIDYKGISVRKFEMSIGFSNGAFSTQYKKNRTIGIDKIEKILDVYSDINPVWLLTGKGDMLLKGEYDCVGDKEMTGVSESELGYEERVNYAEKYIAELEKQVELLRIELKQKQDLIDSFISGDIVKLQ